MFWNTGSGDLSIILRTFNIWMFNLCLGKCIHFRHMNGCSAQRIEIWTENKNICFEKIIVLISQTMTSLIDFVTNLQQWSSIFIYPTVRTSKYLFVVLWYESRLILVSRPNFISVFISPRLQIRRFPGNPGNTYTVSTWWRHQMETFSA